MAITFQTLKNRVGLGVLRSDIAAASNGYGDFVNEAIQFFTNKQNWISQRKQTDVTILQGNKTVLLPADFKELQARNSNGSPVALVLNDPNNVGAVAPIDVVFEAQEIRRMWQLGGLVSIWFGELRAFLKKDSTGSYLGLATPAIENMTFRINYIATFPAMTGNSDTNPLANDYPNMVIAQAKAFALATINDATAVSVQAQADSEYVTASHSETRADVVGRDFRM